MAIENGKSITTKEDAFSVFVSAIRYSLFAVVLFYADVLCLFCCVDIFKQGLNTLMGYDEQSRNAIFEIFLAFFSCKNILVFLPLQTILYDKFENLHFFNDSM